VSVTCGAKVSLTDNRGSFTYVSGESCTFSIANIVLRQEGGISDGANVFENNLPVAQFLQSLDNDNNPSNGITISAEVTQLLIDNGITTLPSSDAELESIITLLQDQGTSFFGVYVSKAEAQVHLDETANSLNTPEPAPAPEPAPEPAPAPVIAVVTEPEPVPVIDTTSGAS
jgi:hypothetical protein